MHEHGSDEIRRRESDERGSPDRRRRTTPMLSRYLFWGHRRGGRRAGEQTRVYVDRPGPGTIVACALVVALSIADAYVTLRILAEGGEEVNPLMRAVLALGHRPFVIVKVGLTVAGAAVLCLHKTWPLGRVCLGIALGGYAILTAYHIVVHAMRAWTG